jgi:hypothetical protein
VGGQHLREFCEEPLDALGRNAEAYQFTSSGGLLESKTAIRIVRVGERILLTAHEKLWLESDRRWTKKLMLTDWGAMQEALQKANFWTTTELTGVPMLDGMWWTIEGLRGGRSHAARGSQPVEGPEFELGSLFWRLAGLPAEKCLNGAEDAATGTGLRFPAPTRSIVSPPVAYTGRSAPSASAR